MLAGIAFSLFAVYLLEHLYSLLVTFFYLAKLDVLAFKFNYRDVVNILTAAECVLLDVLCEIAYMKLA